MKTSLRTLVLAIGCVGSASAMANAGLTSAGVNQPQSNNADEPTLAQVAPIQNGVAAGQANAGGAVPGTAPSAAARAGIASGTQPGEARQAEQAKPPAPPPPPDPAKLPVSVIRPLNRSAAPAPPAGEPPPVSSTIRPHGEESHPEAKKAPAPSASQHATTASPPTRPPVHARPATPAVAPVSHDAKATESASSDGTGDASSSGFIFYTGLGVAAAILLLSFGAFFRGGTDEHSGTGSR